ncbi:hypothetical protein Hypma_015626 [Hypsizygus marmoreus]|uniref:Uncharacterized protein n=1 Tax=Hypsizygus marmoreus TaxID=39966 RepID=A0A369K727_HYPMA|nr:hypothetical protein Hypma_015626 [Hypsizygus marmoreus]
MHHRALRLLISAPYHPHAATLTFTSILQVAAGRAWTRTANPRSPPAAPRTSAGISTNATQTPSFAVPSAKAEQTGQSSPSLQEHSLSFRAALRAKKAELSSISSSSSHPARIARRRQSPSVAYLEPETVEDSDFHFVDPGRSPSYPPDTPQRSPRLARSSHRHYRDFGSPVGSQLSQPLRPLFPLAKSPPSLYQNLLYLLSHRDPLPSLPALLDYHDLHPGLRTTRSYNLLIALALRNGSYGTVEWLLATMRVDRLRGDLETQKLKVRWLVQSGWWNQAWDEVVTASPAAGTIPLPIWLEFFRTLKRGTIRRRPRGRRALNTDDGGDAILCPSSEVVTEPSDPTNIYSARHRVLISHQPAFTPQELAQTPPRAVYSIVMLLLKSRQSNVAFSLTKMYLVNLPRKIPSAWARTCLDIIHLHIAMGSSHSGLRKLIETRRTLISLILSHSALRPTSTTLFLLLAPLRQARRSGTVAWNILRRFKAQWGPAIEDRRVRRRVAQLATKEGRMDIVDAIIRAERPSRWAHATWKLTRRVVGDVVTSPPHRLLRPPAKKIFRHNGREQRHWCHLMKRTRRMKNCTE